TDLAPCRTTRALMTALRLREVIKRLACRLARRPRPKRERLPEETRPDRDTPPPAFRAAASAWATKGLAAWARVERMRPGRTRNSCSSAIGILRAVRNTAQNQSDDGGAHG